MESIDETHSGVAKVTPQGQLRTLHCTTDGGGSLEPSYGVHPSASPVRSTTRGEAEENESSPVTHGHKAGNRQALMPCSIERARQLIKAGRVKKRWYNPYTIQLKDRQLGDDRTAVQAKPNTVHGIRTGDLVRIRSSRTRRWTTGRVKVAAGQRRVAISAKGEEQGQTKASRSEK